MNNVITQFLNHLSQERRLSAHTVTSYRNDLIQFQDFLHDKFEQNNIIQATHEMIRSWMVELSQNNISNRTINRKIVALRTFYKYLIEHEKITKSPVAKITTPKTEKRLPAFVHQDEIQQLFSDHLYTDDFFGIRDKTILMLLYYTGMRKAELINLKITDIDFYDETLKVLGKRNKERIIPIHPKLKKQLQHYLKQRNNQEQAQQNYLFLSTTYKKLNPRSVYTIVKKYLHHVTTITKRSPHTMRHTFATHMLNNGADLNTIKELLGHANLSATQIYTHNSIEKLKKIHQIAHPRGAS